MLFFCIYYTRPLTLPPALLIWFSFFDKTLQGISWESKLANIPGLLVCSSSILKSKIYRRKGGIYLDCADCWEGRISGQWQRCARGVQLTRPGRFHTNLTICDDWQPGRSVNMVERFWSNDGHTLRREGRLLLVSLVGRNKKLFKSFLSYIWQQMEANDKQKKTLHALCKNFIILKFFYNFNWISQFQLNITILTEFHDFDWISQFQPNFTISTELHNLDWISQFWLNFTILTEIHNSTEFHNFN